MRYSAKILIVLFVGVSSSVEIVWNSRSFDEEWSQFKFKYHKTYKNRKHDLYRKKLYFENVKTIAKHNDRFKQNLETYEKGVNKHTDMEFKELTRNCLGFNAQILELRRTRNSSISYASPRRRTKLPKSVNWAKNGAVTTVKDQRNCGSCYSFASIGSVEGQFFRKHKKLVDLSAQQLVDCSHLFGNYGCNGGLLTTSFDYIKHKGIVSEVDYPYVARENKCTVNEAKRRTKVKYYIELPEGDEQALKKAVAFIGPISTGIVATINFFDYKGGIYYDPLCSTMDLNHGVLVVGYGTDNGTDYWLIKNSHGETFGVDGYMKLARNKNNHCQIATFPTYPVL